MSTNKVIVNSAHGPGNTCLAFSRDGSLTYTGGNDTLVRVWRTDRGADHEPDVAYEANESITAIATGSNCWLSGSEDSEVRRYAKGACELEGLVTSANGVAIRCLAIDPKGKRVAVTSEETTVKLIDLEETTKISLLEGHSKSIRKVTWHPSGSLLTTCGADGKIIVWDVSEEESKQVKVIEGVIPAVADAESPEFLHDCSAVWHTSGQHFFVPTRTHEIITVSRSTWSKTSTFSDDASLGDITALALSVNGIYLASSSQAGVFIWSTQTRRVLFRHPATPGATVTQLAFSPTENLLAWTDTEGVLTRWPQPIPASSPDPVKHSSATFSTTVPVKRKSTPTLFDDDLEDNDAGPSNDDGEQGMVDLDNDDWILDDLGGGMNDEPERKKSGIDGFVKEMVSVTKAQPPFQPGSTPMSSKKRYLAYNMVGVIEVTDQDTHHIVNVEFHDHSTRKGTHFTDHFKYDLASLGERGALYACQPENEHLAHVSYKPYGTWASQGEWTYELPKGVKPLGVAAGGPRPTKSQRVMSDGDLQGYGNVVIATNKNRLTFLSGTGIERYCIGLDGDFVSMVAGPEWVFVVHRDGATTIDGSQNLMGTLFDFEDFCILQNGRLPVSKGHTLKWIGVTEDGAPAIYDSSGTLSVMPRFRIPLRATWVPVLDTNTLERREGKDESYWPVGVTSDTFMCLILKGRQEYPGFPRPLIQELPLRLTFERKDPKEGPLEEHFARESMLLSISRDALGEELSNDDISRRELALDKELIQLIQNACKNDKLPRALDLTGRLHHTASFDMATKIAGFYHLIGLQEKMVALKEDRLNEDRMLTARDKRRKWRMDSDPVPGPRLPQEISSLSRSRPFQDFGPPPVIPRPGLTRARPNGTSVSSGSDMVARVEEDQIDADYSLGTPNGKRKRVEDDYPIRDSTSPDNDSTSKRQASLDLVNRPVALSKPKTNPFAKKPGTDSGARNPFARNSNENKSLHKSESFFDKVEAAETDKIKHNAGTKGKGKEKKQTTLFGLPPGAPAEKKGRKKKTTGDIDTQAAGDQTQTQDTQIADVPQDIDSQVTDVTMSDELASSITAVASQVSQVESALPIPDDEMGDDSLQDDSRQTVEAVGSPEWTELSMESTGINIGAS